MEIVAQTDYQDVYRITDGVLLVVNKFISIDYSDKTKEYIRVYMSKAKYKSYNKNCQTWLKVLKEDYVYEYCPVIIPKGKVTYYVDMVERKFAQSSTAPFDKRYDLLDSVDNMFKVITQ